MEQHTSWFDSEMYYKGFFKSNWLTDYCWSDLWINFYNSLQYFLVVFQQEGGFYLKCQSLATSLDCSTSPTRPLDAKHGL